MTKINRKIQGMKRAARPVISAPSMFSEFAFISEDAAQSMKRSMEQFNNCLLKLSLAAQKEISKALQ